jgi:hypothetical protein
MIDRSGAMWSKVFKDCEGQKQQNCTSRNLFNDQYKFTFRKSSLHEVQTKDFNAPR